MPQPTKKDLKFIALMDRMMRSIERPYTKAIIKEKNRYIREVADKYKDSGEVYQGALVGHIANMRAIGEKYNSLAIFLFAKFFQNKIVKGLEKKQTPLENFIDSMLHYWIANQTGKDAKETAETTEEDIKRAIESAKESGETASADVAKQILRARGLSPFRADTIARTETHNASMYVMKESANKLQVDTGAVLNKKWIPTQDARVRDAHAAMASHPAIPLNEKFTVDGKLMDRPGDPTGGASNVIRCRCVLGFQAV